MFPHLESLSVKSSPLSETVHPLAALSNAYSGTSGRGYLSVWLARLANLHTLRLDFDTIQDARAILGASGALDLTSLPNLHTLEIPLRFFIRKKTDGADDSDVEAASDAVHAKDIACYHPINVLPKSLKSLTLLVDHRTLRLYHFGGSGKVTNQHDPPLLGFLEALSETCSASFHDLQEVRYQKSVGSWNPHVWLRIAHREFYENPPVIFNCEGNPPVCIPRLRGIFDSFSRSHVRFSGSVTNK